MPYPIQNQHHSHNHPRQLQYRNLIPGPGHARQPACAAFERRAKGGESIRCAVDDVLVARVVVDVDCDAAQRRDFGGEVVEAGVVLSGVGLG